MATRARAPRSHWLATPSGWARRKDRGRHDPGSIRACRRRARTPARSRPGRPVRPASRRCRRPRPRSGGGSDPRSAPRAGNRRRSASPNREAAVHVAVRHRCVAPLVDVDETRLAPVVRHPVRERTARLSPKQATASLPAVLDVVLRGGDVVDGTGGSAPARRRRDPRRARRRGRRRSTRTRRRTIDADGLVVAPGFVDIHTHYDAQVLWDPMCTPSPLHGVTTVVGGNCGFTIAPLGDAGDVDYVMRMMARVEGMSIDALERGRRGSGGSFGEWLDRIDGRLGVNAGFLVGHSTMRRLVMGDAAVRDAATPGADRGDGRARPRGDGERARSACRRRWARRTPTATATRCRRAPRRTTSCWRCARGTRPRGHDARVHRRDGRDRRRSHRADDRHVARGEPPAELEPAREPLPHGGLRAAAHVVRPRHRAGRARRRAHAARPHAAAREPHARRPPGLARRRRAGARRTTARRSPTRRRGRRSVRVRRKRLAAGSARSPSPSCSRSPTRPPGRRR